MKTLFWMNIFTSLCKNEKEALYFLKKRIHKLYIPERPIYESNAILISPNPEYKIWTPLKKFKWKNPKYILHFIDSDAFKFKFKAPELKTERINTSDWISYSFNCTNPRQTFTL